MPQKNFRALVPAILVPLFLAAAVRADVKFVGSISVDGQGTDLSGLPGLGQSGGLLEDGHSPQNALNGFGSGIAYAGGNTYYLLPDRGPNKLTNLVDSTVDNTTSWDDRYQALTINFVPVQSSLSGGVYTQYTGQYTNTSTVLLKNPNGVQFQGLSTGFSTDPNANHRLDPESIRVAADGTTWISDEYGPFVYHFNQQGQAIGYLNVPANVEVQNPAKNASLEAANNTTGRVTNKGAEGLAITPDGKTMIVAMQDPLIQDGGGNSVQDRILVYDLTQPTAAPKQFLYTLNSTAYGISDILAVNNHQILVDERDGVAGANGNKLLYSIDLDQSGLSDLGDSTNPIPSTAVGFSKSLFANIGGILNSNAASAFVTANGLPDKIEGYTLGPDLPDGRHLLLATNDNDFTQPGDSGYRPNYVFAFAFTDADLGAGSGVPEPASLGVLAVGAVGLLVRRRRR